MATTISNGTAVSISNTPQANNDLFTAVQTGLSETALGVVYLNVMANDQGGAAKSLYSLDSGTQPTVSLEQQALLIQDTARVEAISTDYSAHGAHIWITVDGKVGYDASHLDASWLSQSFSTAGCAQDSFTYAIRLGNGTLSWATAYVDIAPPPPAVTLAHDMGISNKDGISCDGTLAVSGIAHGANVEYSVDNGAHWSSSFSAVEGLNTVQVRQTDVAGNTSAACSYSFTLDTSAAAAPGVALTTDSGSSASDHITNVGTLNLSGVESGATVQYSVDGGHTWSGSFSASEGLNNVQVRQTDVAGNVSSATSFSFTLDTSAAAPGVALTTDSGSSASDHITNVGTLNLSGVESGATVQYSTDGGQTWSTAFSATEGVNDVQVRQTDVAGNVSSATSFSFTLDTSAAAPGVALTTDSGSSASDHITNVGTLNLSGVESGATVQYSVDGGHTWSGSFSASEGLNNVQVRQTDVAGNVSSATSFSFTLDTSAAAPGVALTTDSGSSATDHITNVGTLNLSGVESGATVQYSVDGGHTWSGSFSASEGLNDVQVRQTDVAGNVSSATSFSFTLDTSAAAPGVALTADSGSSATDHITNVGTLNLSGVESGATVQYSVDGGHTWSGSFSASEGLNNVQVRQTDVAGNVSSATSFSFTLDTSAAAPGVALTADSGSSATDHITNVGTLNLSGVESGATVQYSVDGGQTWSTAFSATEGVNDVQVRQTDVAGNVSSATSFSFTLDTSAAAPGVALMTDSGSSATDHITNVGTLNLSGVESGATVQYSTDGGHTWSGSFSASEGLNNVQVRQTDVAGNVSSATSFSFTLDTSAAAPGVALMTDSGSSATDHITNVGTLNVSGVESGATVQYSVDGGHTWSGSFSASEGLNDVQVRQTDVAGNVSSATSFSFTLDTSAAAPGVALTTDSGSSATDHITNVGTLNLSGVESGATVQYSVDGGQTWSTAFSATEGVNDVQVRQTDVAGNVSSATSFSFTLDTSAAAPGVALTTDSGSSATDHITNVGTLNLSGVESGATVQYSTDGGHTWSGSFSASEGLNDVQVRQTDVAGNVSSATSFSFTLDTSAAAPGVALTTDSGSSATDHITNVGTLNLSGVESGATVQYSTDGGHTWSGSFSASEGLNDVQVRQTDVAGNVSSATSFSFTLDTSAAAPGVALTTDSGSSATDHITNVGTLNLSGVESGATVQYSTDGGQTWSTAFSATEGVNDVQVRQADVAGNVSSATSFSFTLDTSAAAPGVALTTDSGSSASDHITNVGTLNLSGVESGATVQYSTDGGQTWSTAFSATEGVNDVQVRQTDVAGNVSSATSFSFTLDTSAAAPGVALMTDSGSSATDHITNVSTLNLSGVESGATVQYSVDGGHTWSGSFSASEGLNDVQVRQTDVAGNVSSATSFSFTLDTSAAAPGVALTTDSGSSASDHITNVGTLNLSGVESGATVQYSVDGGHTWSGSFSASEGLNDVQVRQTDVAGNVSSATSFSFTLDTSAAAPGVALTTDSGSSASDHITNVGTLNLSGVESGATVQYSVDGGHTWSGSFSASEGLNDVQVRQTDVAGNVSSATSFSFTLDTSAAAPGVALTTDSGSSASDHITNVGTLNLSGVESGATVQYSTDGGHTWSTAFSATEGVNDVQVRQTDVAGNVSSATSFSFTLDTSAAAPGVALTADSGSSATDHITNVGTLNLSGVESGATVQYSVDGGHTWSGSFSASEGLNDVQVRQTDVAGNVSSVTSFSFTLDTSSAAPGVALTTDSGSSATDHITNVGTLNLSGVESGATVQYSVDGGHTWSGSFSASEGLNNVQVRQTDVAGNVSSATSFSFTLDTSAAAPGVALMTDSGSSATDHITNVGTLNLSGVESGATVQYSTDGGHTWSGSFSASEGLNNVQVRQTDVAGNVSSATSFSFTLDTSAAAPGVALTTDSGSSASDHITNVGTLNISGVESGATVQYSTDGGHTWSTAFSATEGVNDVQVRQTDVAGNVSSATSFSFTLDTSAAAPGVALTTDSGSSASDHITNVGTLNLSGVESGATVQYSTDGGHTWSGSFSASEGLNDVQVRQTDVAGNVSSATSFSFTLDTTPPSVLSWQYKGNTLTASTDASNVWKVGVHDNTTSTDYSATQQSAGTWTVSQQGLKNDSLTVTEWDLAGNKLSSTNKAPAGAAGSEINLALADPSSHAADLTVTIAGVPSGWHLNAGTDLGNGTWTVPANDLGALTVTPPASFTGATVLTVTENWTNTDGSHTTLTVADNVEAYAANAPIFAWSGDDHLTGSAGSDLFVFAQPIGNDTVHDMNVALDKIDVVGFTDVTNFTDLQAHMTDDAHGNALITLGANETITVLGVHSADLTAGNFVFDQTPVMSNAGVMTLNDGAMLPIGGTIDNTGTIALASTGHETDLEVLVRNATLEGGGNVTLSDDSHNVIFGGTADATLINVDNTISGAGQIGAGQLSLDNGGTIVANGTHSLLIDTGSNAVVNTGTLEATGAGGLEINGAVANSGNLWANGGNLTVHGDVTGGGSAMISGAATLEFGAASAASTTFADGAAGTLKLDQAASFTGIVSGFAAGDTLDLADVLSSDHTTLSFAANATGTGGTLTVSDGVHTANISMQGNLSGAGFHLAHDQGSGTIVTYVAPPHIQEY
ncbi:Ig-like domain-containing protein [Paraburkholderia sacchari]|uniref:Ig-like domain-containing protein n=1 Tax=Paraburkholderia sacchari TaxID=159450 RepID=UPI003D97F4A0